MSNAIYPTFPGLKWGSKKKPVWSTKVQRAASGKELRASFYSYPEYHFTLSYEVLRGNSLAEFQQLIGFFNARQGSFDSFLYKDPSDYSVTSQLIGAGDGARTQYQLVRDLGGFLEPVVAPKGDPSVFFDGNIVGTNMLANPGFESGVSAGGWAVYGNASPVTVGISGGALEGASYTFVSSASQPSGTVLYYGQEVALPVGSIGQTFTASALIYEPVATSHKFVAQIDWYTSGGAYISTSVATDNSPPSNTWETISVTGVAPSGAGIARVQFGVQSTAISSIGFGVDACQFIQGSARTHFASSSTHFTHTNGLLTFTPPPGSGVQITWSGEFYYRVRFMQDSTEFDEFMKQLWSNGRVEFKSIKLGS